MYEGDKTKDAQSRDKKGLMKSQHVNNVGEHRVQIELNSIVHLKFMVRKN